MPRSASSAQRGRQRTRRRPPATPAARPRPGCPNAGDSSPPPAFGCPAQADVQRQAGQQLGLVAKQHGRAIRRRRAVPGPCACRARAASVAAARSQAGSTRTAGSQGHRRPAGHGSRRTINTAAGGKPGGRRSAPATRRPPPAARQRMAGAAARPATRSQADGGRVGGGHYPRSRAWAWLTQVWAEDTPTPAAWAMTSGCASASRARLVTPACCKRLGAPAADALDDRHRLGAQHVARQRQAEVRIQRHDHPAARPHCRRRSADRARSVRLPDDPPSRKRCMVRL